MDRELPNAAELGHIIETCLLAGKIILQSGGETYRVEDTMVRIAAAFGYPNAQSFVIPTGIIFSVDGVEPATKLVRISERSTNLRKVLMVNDLSRRISMGELTAEEAHRLMHDIDAAGLSYSVLVQIAAAAVASGCFLIMFQGIWADFIPAFVAGGLGYACSVYLHRVVPIKFFAEFFAALVLGAVSYGFVALGWGHHLNTIIVGSVMPLVPGLLITNAIRDLMAGHLVSGISKGAEAFFTAFAIGAGIAFVLSLCT